MQEQWRTASIWYPNDKFHTIAGLIYPFMPFNLWYVGRVWSVVPLTTTIVAIGYLFLKLWHRITLKNSIIIGLIMGLSVSIKGTTLLLPIVIVITLLWKHKNKISKILFPIVAMLLTFTALVSPLIIRSYKLTSNPSLSSESAALFLKGNTFSRDIFRLGPDVYALEFASQDSLRLLYARLGADTTNNLAGIISREQAASSEMKKWVVKHPVLFLRKLIVQAIAFWFLGQNWKVSIALAIMNTLLITLTIVGVIRAQKYGLSITPFLIFILYFWGLHSAILAIYRYSVPIMPFIFLFALLGVRRWRNA